ncbi:PfkB family carbohydrate kinase [Nocardia transvalensis]|uniref:PfkB family carbohydrate kinase n=1 Tax=Nocardia transvalensis TaxID=37333 RepID=UPI0018936A41|nr:PfkB family carbohydrate kinase [Nocardia transvalensis]MBF6327798.1 hypothetical protein [Nocardia transvalensis]
MSSRGPLVVVGDVLLDIDVQGRADRCSPDAPVPVVDVATREFRPGGAGLAALLATADSDEVILIGGFGADAAAERLRALLAGRVELAELRLHGTTVCKERIRAVGPCAGGPGPVDRQPEDPGTDPAQRPVPITRLDYGDGHIADDEALPGSVRSALRSAGSILVADYGRGVAAHPQLLELLAELAADIPIVWDPHPRGGTPVRGAALATPNRAEAAAFVPGWPDFGNRARELTGRWGTRAVVVTLGGDGAVFYRRGSREFLPIPVPARLRPAPGADTCGAGDRFSAAAAAALNDGHGLAYAVRHAVDSAAEFVCAGAASGMRLARRPHPARHLRAL